MQELRLALSPCPNDTFSFYLFLEKKAKTYQIKEVVYEDIQKLNELSQKENYDLIKVSAAQASFLLDTYDILPSGAALGYGVGPLLLSSPRTRESVLTIAFPGNQTSAYVLYDFYSKKTGFGKGLAKKFMYFRDILNLLEKGELGYGVVIHEGRFVYQQRGLILEQDLGEYWEKETGYPVPLGVIMIKKALPENVKKEVQENLHYSIKAALKAFQDESSYYKEKIFPFVEHYADTKEKVVIEQHITTYVNAESVYLSAKAQEALKFFMEYSYKLLAQEPTF
ncbi:MAG: hypothetical protein NZM25_02590 [Leptospiraceae bacterium]|nr:hypothetical protein [Leptospiraceae bacterium]MDW8307156.1 MqnA/MqnD/SBP family protein [Leptospiraceae bacterium]